MLISPDKYQIFWFEGWVANLLIYTVTKFGWKEKERQAGGWMVVDGRAGDGWWR